MSSLPPTKRRLIGDLRLLKQHPEDYFDAVADQENMYIWYFLLTNFKNCSYEGGYYIGKLLLDDNYPFKAGNIQMLTPSGRFNVGTNICVTNTAYHQSEYNVTWNIKSSIIGFHSIMMSDDPDNYGLSHIRLSDTSAQERVRLAKASVEYNRKHNLKIFKMFDRFVGEDGYPLETIIMNRQLNSNTTKVIPKSITPTTPTTPTTPIPTPTPTPTIEQNNNQDNNVEEKIKQEIIEIETKIETEIPITIPNEVQIETKIETEIPNEVQTETPIETEIPIEILTETKLETPTEIPTETKLETPTEEIKVKKITKPRKTPVKKTIVKTETNETTTDNTDTSEKVPVKRRVTAKTSTAKTTTTPTPRKTTVPKTTVPKTTTPKPTTPKTAVPRTTKRVAKQQDKS